MERHFERRSTLRKKKISMQNWFLLLRLAVCCLSSYTYALESEIPYTLRTDSSIYRLKTFLTLPMHWTEAGNSIKIPIVTVFCQNQTT